MPCRFFRGLQVHGAFGLVLASCAATVTLTVDTRAAPCVSLSGDNKPSWTSGK
jgi:hypothetical protein